MTGASTTRTFSSPSAILIQINASRSQSHLLSGLTGEPKAVMVRNNPSKYRVAADRCRTKSPSSADPREWTRFSQEWEKLAEMTEALDGSLTPGSSESCENPRKTLLLAGVFCPRRPPSFQCDPLSCEMSELARRPGAGEPQRANKERTIPA